MKPHKRSYLFLTMSLVALLIASIVVAGCIDKGTQTTVATPAPIVPPTIVGTQQQTPAPVSTTAPVSSGTISISGSTTVLPIVQAAADKYMAVHPGINIQVSGGGSGVGIQAIGAKTVDIGMTSAEVTAAQKAQYPSFVITTVAHDGVAVIANPKNTIQYITFDQLKNIYLGKITKWTEITGAGVPGTNNMIVVVGRDSASGTRTYFDSTVLGTATPVNTMLEKNSNGAVTQTVAQTPGAIGYVSIGFVSNDVKAVPIWFNNLKIVAPSISTVTDKSYPFSRDLYLVTNGQPAGLTGDFIKYLLSPDGQKIVTEQGYVALTT
jgi:phosphate transport system substrate-binding protein